jgi:hypothetical protein
MSGNVHRLPRDDVLRTLLAVFASRAGRRVSSHHSVNKIAGTILAVVASSKVKRCPSQGDIKLPASCLIRHGTRINVNIWWTGPLRRRSCHARMSVRTPGSRSSQWHAEVDYRSGRLRQCRKLIFHVAASTSPPAAWGTFFCRRGILDPCLRPAGRAAS